LRRLITAGFGVVLGLALLDSGAPAVADQGFLIVVHSDVKGGQIPREALSLIFLKKAPRWGDGSSVAPVDQSLRSQGFWHKQMASGVAPPPVKSSDEEVLSYVASTPGAIGYVSSGVSLPSGVRTIIVID